MKLIYPIKGISGYAQISDKKIYISQRFAETKIDYSQFGWKGHTGVDIAAPAGTPILAAHDGKVSYYISAKDKYGRLTGYGNYTKLNFDEDGFGWEITDGHMSGSNGGDRNVKQGEVIGYVGTTGNSTGNHDHFGLKQFKNGKLLNSNNGYGGSIDPAQFITKGETMKLVKDGDIVYITGGNNINFKIGISDLYTLGIFGDEPVETGDLSTIKSEYTLSQGWVITRK